MNHNPFSLRQNFKSNFGIIPIQLKAFFVFCFLVSSFEILIFLLLPKSFKESIIPVTGWLPSFPYIAVFVYMMHSLGNSNGFNRKHAVNYSLTILIIVIVFGIYDIKNYKGLFQDNPYLYHSPYRPIWTVGVPAFWILVLISEKMKGRKTNL